LLFGVFFLHAVFFFFLDFFLNYFIRKKNLQYTLCNYNVYSNGFHSWFKLIQIANNN